MSVQETIGETIGVSSDFAPEIELDTNLFRDVGHPAVAEHGHQDRDLAARVSYLDAAALAPVDLHGLRRLVVDFLIDATACGTD